MQRLLWMLWIPAFLTGCDQLSERAGFPNAAKVEAEGKAIGGACRHAGRGLEDCYTLNPTASKSAIYEGWKEMNEYMAKNGMQAIPPQIEPAKRKSAADKTEAPDESGEGVDAKADAGKTKAEKTAAAADKD